jgi:putative transposase
MKVNRIKTFYRRSLPHLQPVGATFFVTFRLAGSIPKIKILELQEGFEEIKNYLLEKRPPNFKEKLIKEHYRFFLIYDDLLHKINSGPHFLKIPNVASIVADQIHELDGEFYDLITYCIMSNHVHILVDTSLQLPDDFTMVNFEHIEFEPLDRIMKRIKGASARFANLELNRTGSTFWQKESYDRFVRTERELNNTIAYILNNPVKANLVSKWDEFPFTFLKYCE